MQRMVHFWPLNIQKEHEQEIELIYFLFGDFAVGFSECAAERPI